MWDKLKRNYFINACLLLLIFHILSEISIASALSTLGDLLNPLVLGLALAFIVNMPMRFYERQILLRLFKNPSTKLLQSVIRITSICMSYGTFMLVIYLLFRFASPYIANSINDIAANLPKWSLMLDELALNVSHAIPGMEELFANESFTNASTNWIVAFIEDNFSFNTTFNTTFNFLSQFFVGATKSILGVFLSVYVLFNKERMGIQTRRMLFALLPEVDAEYILRISTLADQRFESFLKSQTFDSAMKFLLFLVVFWIFKFPYPVLISLLIGVLQMVPIFGVFVGFTIGLVLTAIASPSHVLWYLVVYTILEQIEENIIYPNIVGKAIGLDGFWVILAVWVGGSLWGVGGLLLAIPITSIASTIASDYVDFFIAEKNIPPERYL
ncbi:MAG: AI-2E family transporter [Eubacteriaceae bacterium]|nr:AI-2E family transporter [Eubacteriaceae bacterium]